MDDSPLSDRTGALSEIANDVVEYQTRMNGATREVRMALVDSGLETSWSKAMHIFMGDAPEARELLLLIVERIPEDPMFPDLGQFMIELWLSPADPSVARWLQQEADSNAKLRKAMIGVDLTLM